jgi:hypothetical protein
MSGPATTFGVQYSSQFRVGRSTRFNLDYTYTSVQRQVTYTNSDASDVAARERDLISCHAIITRSVLGDRQLKLLFKYYTQTRSSPYINAV